MLDPNITEQLRAYLGKLVHPIELVVAFDASPAADELRELIAEIVSLSPNISTREEDR